MTETKPAQRNDTPTPRLSELAEAVCTTAQSARSIASKVTEAVNHISGDIPTAQATVGVGEPAEPICLLDAMAEDVRVIAVCLERIDSQINRL